MLRAASERCGWLEERVRSRTVLAERTAESGVATIMTRRSMRNGYRPSPGLSEVIEQVLVSVRGMAHTPWVNASGENELRERARVHLDVAAELVGRSVGARDAEARQPRTRGERGHTEVGRVYISLLGMSLRCRLSPEGSTDV